MTIDQLQTIVATLQMRHRMDIEATREGEGAEATHTYEQVEESKKLTLPKLDQVDQVEGGDAKYEAETEGAKNEAGTDNGKVTGLFEGDEHTTRKTQCKEGAQVQGHRLDTKKEAAELRGGMRS